MSVIALNGEKFETTDKIEFVENPKKVGKMAWSRYEIYQKAKTIDEFRKLVESNPDLKKYAAADLRYDHSKGYLKVVKPAKK